MKKYLDYWIQPEDEGREVKSILQKTMKLSTKKIRSIKFHEQGILLDGKRTMVRERVKAGQCLSILLTDMEEKEQAIIANPMALDILWEDDQFLFVNKPTGMVCHPAQGHLVDTLVNGVKAYFMENDASARIHLVGRLDKDTSGIVAIAKNKVAAERLCFEKTYYALVCGHPEPKSGYIDITMEETYVGEDERMLKMQRTQSDGGKIAGTHYEVIREYEDFSLCSLLLDTGRTHQIRFHMSEMGWPLLGDSLYGGGTQKGMRRTALHAGKIRFSHPFTGQIVEICAPIPQDMEDLLQDVNIIHS